MCEDCQVQLYLYPQGAVDFPMERGPHYICPQCHIVTDTAGIKPPGLEVIKPIDMSAPAIVLVPEDREGNITSISRSHNKGPVDPEPNEDQWLKNIGATLISKKIDSKSDF